MIKMLVKGGGYIYTHLDMIFEGIELDQEYNWLVCDYECPYYANEYLYNRMNDYVFLTNDELFNYFVNNNTQFIWGAVIAFDKDIDIADILSYEIPISHIDMENKNIFFQHPLSEIEIVAQDSSFFYLMLKNEKYINNFISKFDNAIILARD